jgi:TolB-like protein/DNA-binding winged helix-turn-helix (wHTH) protein/Tfp pilus assembly protein PilF
MSHKSSEQRLLRFGTFQLDLRLSELRKQGLRIKLQEQPCQILALLLKRPGEIVSREELRKQLWHDDTFVDFDHSLNTAIMRLREALGDSSENPRFVETVPRHGYRFIAPVEEIGNVPQAKLLSEQPEAAILATTTPHASGSISQMSARLFPRVSERRQIDLRRVLVFSAFMVIAFVLIFGYAIRYVRNAAAARIEPTGLKSLAVLPLENLSGDKDQEYFADGMTDELIAHLAKIRSLRVISRTSAMEYKGTHKPLSEIAHDLNVDAVVEGTVLRSGDRVRITAELVQVATDRHLWAETYESPMGDILTLQNQVATAIANEIRIELTPAEQEQLASTHAVSKESYEDYLKGRYYWNKRSEQDLNKAIQYFQLATEKDNQSALAYAGLADCYSIIGSAIVGTVPSGQVATKAKIAALKALELDNTLAEAQTSLATVRFNYDWDWTAASNGFQRAIDSNPSYATAYQRYSLYLMALGRTQQSLDEINRARQLDPLSISMNFSLGWRLYMAHQYNAAVVQLRNTLDMDPTFALPRMVLGQTYEQMGSYDPAIAELQKAVVNSHNSPMVLAALGHAYAVANRKAEAEKILNQMTEQSKDKKYVSPFYFASVYAGLKRNEKALDYLEMAYQDRSNGLVFLKVDPQWDTLRSNPRFEALLKNLALPE